MLLVLFVVTFGIYQFVWAVQNKTRMNALGANIPTAWLLIIPFVNIWWMYKFSEGVGQVTRGGLSTIAAFLLLLFLGWIGMLIIQNAFNKVAQPAE